MSREKRIPDFYHTYCPRFELIHVPHKTRLQKMGIGYKQFVLIQIHRPSQTFSRTYLAALIQIK